VSDLLPNASWDFFIDLFAAFAVAVCNEEREFVQSVKKTRSGFAS